MKPGSTHAGPNFETPRRGGRACSSRARRRRRSRLCVLYRLRKDVDDSGSPLDREESAPCRSEEDTIVARTGYAMDTPADRCFPYFDHTLATQRRSARTGRRDIVFIALNREPCEADDSIRAGLGAESRKQQVSFQVYEFNQACLIGRQDFYHLAGTCMKDAEKMTMGK